MILGSRVFGWVQQLLRAEDTNPNLCVFLSLTSCHWIGDDIMGAAPPLHAGFLFKKGPPYQLCTQIIL